MASENKNVPYTIPMDNRNALPPPYGIVGLSYSPYEHPNVKQDEKPDAGQQPTENNTSTIMSLPEIIVDVDDQDTLVANMIFSLKSIRHAFIKKVFFIVLVQLLITAFVTYGLMKWELYMNFALGNIYLVLGISVSCYITTFLAMLCFTSARRKVPYNYMFLLLFTLSLTVLLPLVIVDIPFEQIVFAASSTFAIVTALTLFAFQTKIDFTYLSGFGLSLVVPMIVFGIGALMQKYDTLQLLYVTIVVIMISVYIVIDIQLIIGGEHRLSFSPEEYVFAALVLYVDIMYLFMKLLRFANR